MTSDRDAGGAGGPPAEQGPHRAKPLVPDYPTAPTRAGPAPSESLHEATRLVPTFDTGAMVDHYRIMRLLGHGGMGEVYLARDTQLGRKVALKVVHNRHFGSRQARSRFLFEARTTARFNHPHIVTVYAVGEHDGHPYLALEYVEGEDLKARMAGRKLALQETLRIAHAVALALLEAHRHGVLHRDLKPGNVRIGLDGRVRVLDFGLATVAEDDLPTTVINALPTSVSSPGTTSTGRRTSATGTPQYMAPEQWRENAATEATDIWALGVLLFLMMSGRLPYVEQTLVDLALAVCGEQPAPRLDAVADAPAALDQLVARCLSKAPEQRPTAAQVVDELELLLARSAQAAREDQDPFRGLLPFTAEHAQLFFGREAEIASFVERARLDPVLPVVGPSASGKSSFVRAGVIPRLREQGLWIVLQLRPGSRPFHALAARILGLEPEQGSGPSASSSSGNGRAVQAAQAVVAPPRATPAQAALRDTHRSRRTSNMTLVLDEGAGEAPPGEWPPPEAPSTGTAIVSLAAELAQFPRKLSLELRALADKRGGKVLLFVDQLEELFTLCANEDERRAFMTALCTATDDPADPVRVIFTVRDDFLGRMVTGPEVREALSHLTVIQRPDAETLKQILRRPVELAGYGYEDPSLVDEMVASVAAEPAGLPLLQFTARTLWEQRDRERRLLLRAIYEHIGGVEGALAQHADGVLQGFSTEELALARQMLLRMVTPERTRAIITAQEALEGLGPQAEHVLARLTESRLVSVTKQTSSTTADAVLELTHGSLIHNWLTLARWIDEDRQEHALLNDVRDAAQSWHRGGRQVEDLWRGPELANAVRKLARQEGKVPALVRAFIEASQGRMRRRRRGRTVLVVGVVVTSLVIAGLAVGLSLFVRKQRDAAEQRAAAALREAARAALGQGSLLEARAKVREALEAEDSTAVRTLWWQLRDLPVWWQHELGSAVHGVAFSPDGKTIAAATQSGAVVVFDAATGAPRMLRGHTDELNAVAFSPDGSLLASAGLDRSVVVWTVATGTAKHTLAGHASGVLALAFSRDGRSVGASASDGAIRLWDTASGAPGLVVQDKMGSARALTFSPDGNLIASGHADRTARLWEIASGKSRAVLHGHEREVTTVAFSPDGKLLATGSLDGSARLWSTETGEQKASLSTHRGGVRQLAFATDGESLVTGGGDRTVALWKLPEGTLERRYPLGAEVTGLALARATGLLAVSSADRRVRLLTLGVGSAARLAGHVGAVLCADLAPDGKVAASGGADGAVRLWDVASGQVTEQLSGHAGAVSALEFSPDGRVLASGGADRTIRLWSPRTGAELRTLSGHQGEVASVRFSRDSRMLVSASHDRTVRLWDATSGALIRAFYGHVDRALDASISPKLTWIASASQDGTARLWSIAPGRAGRIMEGHRGRVTGSLFDHDGTELVTVGHDGTVRSWDPLKGPSTVLATAGARANALDLAAGDDPIGVADSDGVARLWGRRDKQATVLRGHRGEVTSLRFSADGKLVVTGGVDGTLRTWLAASAEPLWRAPALLTQPARLLSHEGWTMLEPGAKAPSDDNAAWRRALQDKVRFASQAEQSELLCLLRADRGLELWDRKADRRIGERAEPTLVELLGTPSGCLGHSSDKVLLFDPNGRSVELRVAERPSALGHAPELRKEQRASEAGPTVERAGLLVAAGSVLYVFDSRGEPRERVAISPGATAVGGADGLVYVGYADGSIDVLPLDPQGPRPNVTFERVPSSPVTRLVPGPMTTLFVGYRNGLVGVWDRQVGTQLRVAPLHGAIVHLRVADKRLFAASELGGSVVWDLDTFYADRCSLLREVWAQVPVVWQQGRAVELGPPAKHVCR